MEALGLWKCLATTCAESWRQARGVHVVSEACALRGWRWLALLRRWRWRAAWWAAGASGRRAAPSWTLARRWALTAARWGGPRAWEELVDEELRVGGVGARTEEEMADAVEVEEAEADWSSLDGRAVAARRRWLGGGGRERRRVQRRVGLRGARVLRRRRRLSSSSSRGSPGANSSGMPPAARTQSIVAMPM